MPFIKRQLFDKNKFDPQFGLTGGEDSDLFSRMIEEGNAKFYWCNEAVVSEYVPGNRLTLNWLVKRAFRTGITYTIISNRNRNSTLFSILGLTKAIVGTILFSLVTILGIFRQRKYFVRSITRVCLQIGHVFGFFNYSYKEYK